MNTFLDIPKITHTSRNQLIGMVNAVNNLLQSMPKFEVDVEQWGPILVPIICKKMDKDTLEAWRIARPQKDVPKCKPLIEFLLTRANSVEGQSSYKEQHNQASTNQQRDQPPSKKRQQGCHMCAGAHPIYRCSEFLAKSLQNREQLLKSWRMCTNCLRHNHFKEKCTMHGCKICNIKHNKVLCPQQATVINNHQQKPSTQSNK